MGSVMLRTLIAGNWKMNGTRDALEEVKHLTRALESLPRTADILICPPATLIMAMASIAGAHLKIGGQSCHAQISGAHTGDISADMLRDAGAEYVIVGHSERRDDHAERSAYVKAQGQAALQAGLKPIICVGEDYNQRVRGETQDVIDRIMRKSLPDLASEQDAVIIAYEPKWAIGTGKVPTPDEIGEVHTLIRRILADRYGRQAQTMPILYGGSMKPGNASEILGIEDVNGGLIGGASLKAEDFIAIYKQAVS